MAPNKSQSLEKKKKTSINTNFENDDMEIIHIDEKTEIPLQAVSMNTSNTGNVTNVAKETKQQNTDSTAKMVSNGISMKIIERRLIIQGIIIYSSWVNPLLRKSQV